MATPLDALCNLAATGAGLVIDQQQYTEQDLRALRGVVQASQSTLLFLATHARAVTEAPRRAQPFSDLCHRAQQGKALTLDLGAPWCYPQADLLVLTALAREWGGRLYLLNAHTRDSRDLGRIAAKGRKLLTFDLSQ